MKEIHDLADRLKEIFGATEEIVFSFGQAASGIMATLAPLPHTTTSSKFTISKAAPSSVYSSSQYQTTFGTILSRLAPNGDYENFVRSAAIVQAYEFWEHDTRGAIAANTGTSRNNVTSNVWGDMRHYRNHCAHLKGSFLSSITSRKYFLTGNTITRDEFYDMFCELVDECNGLARTHYPHLTTAFKLV